jgi:transcriptional regulator NrdR family protein
MKCPFCESEDVEIVSPWGGQIITCQVRCQTCNTYFEAIREEFDSATETESAWTISSAGDR